MLYTFTLLFLLFRAPYAAVPPEYLDFPVDRLGTKSAGVIGNPDPPVDRVCRVRSGSVICTPDNPLF